MANVFAWNKSDLINYSSNRSLTIPHKIQSLDGVAIQKISSGQNHTLFCLQNGSVSISVHDRTKDGIKNILSDLGNSKQVRGLHAKKVIQVAAGSSHSVVLTENHRVYTWGGNDKGQLGRENVNRKNRRNPKSVKLLDKHNVVQISCGNDHTLALTNDGLVFVWGSNSYGQLGLGKNISVQQLPEEVKCLRGIPVMQIVAGGDHSFILSKSGALYGWGRNDFGQLGLGETERNNEYVPKKCRLVNDQKIKYVCCGENHTACLTMDGCVLTFGAGSNFQLGHSSNKNESTPKKVMELSGSEVSQIACGSEHTLAYVPLSGILYAFGQGGNEQFGPSSADNNSPTSLSDPFVLNNELPLSCFSMQLNNQGPELSIKSIHAGGDQSLVIVVPANTCDSIDFRKEEPAGQILTLSKERIINLKLGLDGTPSDEFSKEIGTIFSCPSCLNGSFLLPKEGHYGSSSKKHGLDMNAVREFFEDFAKDFTKDQLKFISTKIEEHLIPMLSISPPDVEALRLYLILPECRLFTEPNFYSSVLCKLARSFLSLNNIAMKVFDSWWPSNQPSYFKKLVVAYIECFQFLLWFPKSEEDTEDNKRQRNEDLLTSVEMLKKLYQVNHAYNIIDATTFMVPQLKEKVNIENEYPVFFLFKNADKPLQDLHLCNYPFLFDGETKTLLLQTDANLWKQLTVSIHNGVLKAHHNLQSIDRGNLVNDALTKLLTTDNCLFKSPLEILKITLNMQEEVVFNKLLNLFLPQQLGSSLSTDKTDLVILALTKLLTTDNCLFKLPMEVSFKGENAGGAGVLKEFFKLFFQGVMDPEFDMFTTDDDSKLQWFNSFTNKEPKVFHKIGIFCGLIIYNSVAIDLCFPLALYKKLLKKPVTVDDLTELMPVVGNSLQSLLDFDGDNVEDTFNLTFEWGTACTELCPGGADILVNNDNKNEYVDLCVDYLLNKSVKTQFDVFSEGFHSICGGRIMDSFLPGELRSLVEGNEDYDFQELEHKNTSYEGGAYSKNHQTIKYFWEVFHAMSLTNKKKFLLFLTGSDRIPITGMKNIKINIRPQDGLFPFAFTCYNLLQLPSYSTKEQLEMNLLTAIQCTEGFRLNQD